MVSTSSQIINFLVVGSLVIRKLQVYFESNYDKQRLSILFALCLILISLVLLNTRYALQIITESPLVDLKAMIITMVLSDFIPFVCLIAVIHLSHKGEWDLLLCQYLKPPNHEQSTDAGSHMLSDLREELKMQSLLGSNVFADDHKVNESLYLSSMDADTLPSESQKRSQSLPNLIKWQDGVDAYASTIPPPAF